MMLSVIIILAMFWIYPYETITAQRLHQMSYQAYYHLMMQKLYQLMLPFVVVMFTMDHDQPFLRFYVAYFGKTKVLISKYLMMFIILSWIYVIFFMLYHILPSLLTHYYQITDLYILDWFSLYLDGLLIAICLMSIFKEKYRQTALALPLIYMLYSFIVEDLNIPILFYLFPIHGVHMHHYTFAYLYKMCYIILCVLLTYRQKLSSKIL